MAAEAAPREPSTQLSINSEPDAASIAVNHEIKGNTPLTISDLPPGNYLIHAVKDGYEDHFESVSIEAGLSREINLKLEPLQGLLLVRSEPQGADVSRDGVALGKTPLLATTLPLGTHRLTLAMPGYQNKEINVNLADRTPVKLEVELLADSGIINVSSEPSGAKVLINGINRGVTPCKIDRIPGGSVKLEIREDGYLPHLRDISLAAGEEQSVNITLSPRPGKLEVVSIPDSARLYVNNEFRGDTPCVLDNLPPGDYRIRVEKPGYTPLARNVAVEKGSAVTEEFRMERNTGILTVITAPAGCTVLIDGRKVGITSAEKDATSAVSDPLSINDVMAGERVVEIIRKGFSPEKRAITITQDQTTALQVKLTRQFIPNYEITTTRSYHKGVLEFANEAEIRIETAPGVITSIPMKDVLHHGVLKEE